MTRALACMLSLLLGAGASAQSRPPERVPEPPPPDHAFLVPMPAPPDPDPAARVPSPKDLEGVRVGSELERLVAELDHADFVQRETAMRSLCDDERMDKLQIYAVLARKTLSAEQRHRLMTVVRQRLVDRPRGAVGINMNFEILEPGDLGGGFGAVVVMSVVPGLPADGRLRRGDRITHVDGEPLFNTNDLIRRVQGKLPGETVELVVQRPVPMVVEEPGPRGDAPEVPAGAPRMETLRFTLVLASTDDLETASGTPQAQVGPVVNDRQAEAAAAAERYGPRVKVIELKRDQPPGISDQGSEGSPP